VTSTRFAKSNWCRPSAPLFAGWCAQQGVTASRGWFENWFYDWSSIFGHV
jgi:hypothetical protein